MNPPVIAPLVAVDGPAASGKGSIARRLAAHFGFAHLDTGLLYRAVGVKAAETGLDAAEAARALTSHDLERPDLRGETAGALASKAAAIPAVRAALLQWQRDFAAHPPGGAKGAVLDGRDIGTVIRPDAPAKIFIDAAPEIRAWRRWLELERAAPGSVGFETILAEVQARDARDRGRADSPLRPAPDALLLDTSDMTIEQAVERAIAFAAPRLAGAS